ncbi:Cation efflux protein [uncultured Desulfobacterium sp.]|uniref:Cation efflux protein n=1 Tax=uncultured Desulfobacterium sp. TaxID=201089 RepID=A0A445MZT9_9BACT|nr:Cation efflux protein [uncultured Desulfobacterium sp.]
MEIRQRTSLFAIVAAFILAGCKFAVGMNSGSMAVVSSGLDSLLDVFMSAMNFLAIGKSIQPPDRTHHYGHGKVENLAAVTQSFVILCTGGIIIFKSAQKFLANEEISYSILDAGVMALSLIFSFVISRRLNRVGKDTDSGALKADALHYASDLYSNSAAITAMILTYYTGMIFFDLLFAGIVGIIIISSARKILKSGILGLMDSPIPKSIEKELMEIIGRLSYPCAGIHKLRSRLSGNRKYVDFHLLLCRKLLILDAHEQTKKIEQEIKSKIPAMDVLIHMEPCPYKCELTDATCMLAKTA